MKRFALPSGRVVRLAEEASKLPSFHASNGIFAKAIAVVGAHLVDLDVRELELADFHALRAIASRLGWLEEDTIEIACINCGKPMKIAPCSTFELGPFADGELDDPELDRLRTANDDQGGIRVEPRTLAQAAPLHVALARGPIRINKKIVRALGVVELRGAREPLALAKILRECDDETFGDVADAFLGAAYPARLAAAHACPKCGARNDVDAPYDRELTEGEGRRGAWSGPDLNRASADPFPSFEAFDAEARRIAKKRVPQGVILVVEGGVPECDDGGVPLLGSYVPRFEGSDTAPSRGPEVTVYYRTFRGMHDDEGAHDWRAELEETIEHELEHHGFHLAGHDPMDEQERQEIAREAIRTVGKRELVRRELGDQAKGIADFIRRTWLFWILLLIALFAYAVCGSGGSGSGD